ncbi:MAG TPA: Hpt domain-containing protein, partial [Anaeromyxobacteraceae bacterium]|nr:Hpt domain-containing protein [Anaeromyxobacteraceae bacterium]
MDEFEVDRDALVTAYLAEAEEVLARMELGLVELEGRPSDEELLHALFREAHTLKGGATLVAFDGVRDLAHDLESVLERLRNHTLAIGSALVTLLLRSVDVLRAAIADAAAGAAEPSAATRAFQAELAEVAGAAAP